MSKNGKHGISIALIMLQFICITAILCAFGTGMPAISIFYKNQLKSDADDLVHTAYGVEQTINEWVVTLDSETKLLARHPQLISGINNMTDNKSASLDRLLEFGGDTLDIDYLAFVGTDGRIISARNLPKGQSVASVYAVGQALKGQSAHSYEGVCDIPYAMFYATPIMDGDKQLGVLLSGYSMIDGVLLDLIQRSHNVDCTIFKEDTRLSTTLHGANGQSLVGTKLDNQKIINGVLKNGGQYRGYNTIAGVEYSTVYMPLKSGDGKITGMVFVAKSLIPAQKVKMNTVYLSCIIAILLTIPFSIGGLVFTKWLISRINNVTKFLNEMSTGKADLTKRVIKQRSDEIGDLVDAFDKYVGKMQDIVREVKHSKDELSISGENMDASARDTFEQVSGIASNINNIHKQIGVQSGSVHDTAGAVEQIAKSIDSLEKMIENQSSSVEEASAAIEEMIGNINSVNGNVEIMADSFTELETNAEQGIRTQEAVNDKIHQIETQSEMLQEANATISHIAEQTNLLAMNAAIEAAHAGEAGKGFAVVADEIRKLSETSTSQSKTIGQQLNNIKASINDVATASAASSKAFTAVSGNIVRTNQLVMQIKAAMEEQNVGNGQISEALRIMNDSTVEVRNAAKEMTEGNQAILVNMERLQDSTSVMQNDINDMKAEADRISESEVALSKLAGTVAQNIDKIGGQIDQFTV